jgi:hypothetical protein
MRRSLLNPILAFGVLIILIIGFSYFGDTIEGYVPPQKPQEITSITIGDTVVAGMDIVDDSKIRKVALLYHPTYLEKLFQNGNYLQVINGLTTGAIETPISEFIGANISPQGVAQGFEGPGFLSVQGQQLVVNSPKTFVWSYKTAYTVGVKTANGLEIRNGGKNGDLVKVISESDINNATTPHDYISVATTKKWYSNADTGDYITLDYSLTGFNDGRNLVTPDDIKKFFGQSVVNYMENYPSGSPIMAYNGSHSETVVASYSESLGSYPEYGDAARAYNAKQFAKAWDGTIIPPGTSSSGKLNIGFESIRDPNATATGGYATHGVCPAARSLRGAVTSLGLGLPSGMAWGELAVPYAVSPTEGIKVYNSQNYPMKIIMWTEGSDSSTVIYTKIIKMI